MAARPAPLLQLAKAVAAAQMFLGEAKAVYQPRPRPVSDRLRSAHQVDEFIRQQRPDLVTEPQEMFIALALNSKHCVTRLIEVARGTLGSVDVHPREVFRGLILAAAAATICVHNHPSSDPQPSQDDLALTARLRDVGQLVGIPVIDHLIIGGDDFVSMADRGLL
jgi:DNA repair protein RadC